MSFLARLLHGRRDPVVRHESRVAEGLKLAREHAYSEVIGGVKYDTTRADVLWAYYDYNGYGDSFYGLYRTVNGRYFVCASDSGVRPLGTAADARLWLEKRDLPASVRVFGELVEA